MPGTVVNLTLDLVRWAMTLDETRFDADVARARMASEVRAMKRDPNRPGQAKEASTLMLLFEHAGALHFPLILRPAGEGVHSGQISFPGGRREVGETDEQCARREACEEVGACDGDAIEIIGRLHDLYIPPSDFLVHPYVGYIEGVPTWTRQVDEVVEIIECPLAVLLDDSLKDHEPVTMGGYHFEMHWYEVAGHRVWGATAIMLAEMEGRLRTVLEAD